MTNAEHDPVVIATAAGTVIASFQGAFAIQGAPQLGSAAIATTLERSDLAAEQVDEVVMGCVLPARARRRRARPALGAQLPQATGCTRSTRCAAPACARRCSRTTCCWPAPPR